MPRIITNVGTVALIMLAAACGSSEPAPAPPVAEPSPAAAPEPASQAPATEPADEGHHHTAPHGGALLELGEHFSFLELVVDPATGRVTLYVLDGEAEKAVRVTHPSLTLTIAEPSGVATPLTLDARASTLTGETVGDSSEFTGMLEALKSATAVKARLATISVKGRVFENLELLWPDAH
ncbi:MAG: hypothetical protein AB7L71_04575 [Vicinamibacterales bacterium]